jgi:RAB protein geranylgeranyltransferase component A
MCSFRTSFSIRLHLFHSGKKVLHIDRNPFYGGEGASLNLTNLWKVFRPGKNPPNELGQNRDWNIDLIPKYIMSGGKLVKILLKTRVSRYLEWKSKLILMKVLMELMFSKLNKKDFSVKEELRLKRYLLQTPKH